MQFCVLDIGGTFMKGAVMDENTKILERMKVPSDCSSLEALLDGIDQIVAPVADRVEGIAISMPGKIDCEKGIARTGGSFWFVKDLPVVSILEEKYHLPVTIENDGKAAASAENWKGALKDTKNGLVYILGTGIGGGIILNNQVIKGSHMAAGELSLCLMKRDEGLFSTENIMGMLFSVPGLLRRYQKEAGTDEQLDGVEFFRRVNQGEEAAVAALRYFCQGTAGYFYDLQVILDVDCIAVGGGISEQPVLLQMLNEELDKLFDTEFPLPCVRPRLVKCQYGNDANLIGALKGLLDSGKIRPTLPEALAVNENSPLKGKKILFLGSSVTYGFKSGGKSFVEGLCHTDGIEAVKEAVCGTVMVEETTEKGESFITRMKKLDRQQKADCFVCQLSTNDAHHGKPLGVIAPDRDMAHFDTQTVTGAMEYIIAYAQNTWNCPVVFYTGPYFESEAYGAMVERLGELQQKWDIAVVDLWNDPQMRAVSVEDYRLYMADPVHPTMAGYSLWFLPKIREKLMEILGE